MKVTPDIIRCEFIGARVKVARSKHRDYAGISGKIIDETRNTFTILSNGIRKAIVKESAIFHFTFPDRAVVEINGRLLVGRPEDRLKKHIRRLW
jgi:ribonuclease P protein subunit POP4